MTKSDDASQLRRNEQGVVMKFAATSPSGAMTQLNRRQFSRLATLAPFLPLTAHGQTSPDRLKPFDELLAQTGQDEQLLADARSIRELEFRQDGPSPEALAAAPNLPRRYRSDKGISSRARALIIEFEVTGQAQYQASYRKPIWPKGNSGVTMGIGYDVGYSSRERLTEDWSGILDASIIKSLEPACRVSGAAAAALISFLQHVDVPWTAATQQFDRFTPFVAGETVSAFPGSQALSSDSFGALVSLIYNRGSAMESGADDSKDRRSEMRAIRSHITAGTFDPIPGEIRSMTRLWQGDPNARGLLRRRELEARLFEAGL
jgi:GH24 family phage-related lysozyme (muramidase)